MERSLGDDGRRCCIWCGERRLVFSIEHVIPDALACPDWLTLRDCVCAPCNTRLGRLDRALLKQFELLTVMKGVRRKRGKRPTIDNWPSVGGRVGPHGPEIFVNGGPEPMSAAGRTLRPAHRSHGVSGISFVQDGAFGTMSFSMTFGDDPRFLRSIYKVAYSALAYFEGPSAALAPHCEAVRAFVKTGDGAFAAMMTDAVNPDSISIEPPRRKPDHPCLVIVISILGVSFLLDLAPHQDGLKELIAAAESGVMGPRWTVLPTGWPDLPINAM